MSKKIIDKSYLIEDTKNKLYFNKKPKNNSNANNDNHKQKESNPKTSDYPKSKMKTSVSKKSKTSSLNYISRSLRPISNIVKKIKLQSFITLFNKEVIVETKIYETNSSNKTCNECTGFQNLVIIDIISEKYCLMKKYLIPLNNNYKENIFMVPTKTESSVICDHVKLTTIKYSAFSKNDIAEKLPVISNYLDNFYSMTFLFDVNNYQGLEVTNDVNTDDVIKSAKSINKKCKNILFFNPSKNPPDVFDTNDQIMLLNYIKKNNSVNDE
jgi:hypothetical protein